MSSIALNLSRIGGFGRLDKKKLRLRALKLLTSKQLNQDPDIGLSLALVQSVVNDENWVPYWFAMRNHESRLSSELVELLCHGFSEDGRITFLCAFGMLRKSRSY